MTQHWVRCADRGCTTEMRWTDTQDDIDPGRMLRNGWDLVDQLWACPAHRAGDAEEPRRAEAVPEPAQRPTHTHRQRLLPRRRLCPGAEASRSSPPPTQGRATVAAPNCATNATRTAPLTAGHDCEYGPASNQPPHTTTTTAVTEASSIATTTLTDPHPRPDPPARNTTQKQRRAASASAPSPHRSSPAIPPAPGRIRPRLPAALTHRIHLTAVVALALIATAGCGNDRPTPASAQPTASMVTASGATAPGPVQSPPPASPAGPDPEEPGPDPTYASSQAALVTATGFIRAWAHPQLPAAVWLAGVRPYATPDLARKLATVDPANVPAHTTTGPAWLISATPTVAIVAVPTDAGAVVVVCRLTQGRWSVASIDRLY
jgi:hypothetical protein